MTLAASVIGVTSLIFNAKGHPFGQVLMVMFSLLYGMISFTFSYYGEMATYLGMTAPKAVFSLVSWLAPYFLDTLSIISVSTYLGFAYPYSRDDRRCRNTLERNKKMLKGV